MIDVNLFLRAEKHAACYRDPAQSDPYLFSMRGEGGGSKGRIEGLNGRVKE